MPVNEVQCKGDSQCARKVLRITEMKRKRLHIGIGNVERTTGNVLGDLKCREQSGQLKMSF